MKMAKNERSVGSLELGMDMPLTFTGNTALGWSMRLNSFCITLIIMTPLMHLNPPLVEPAHEPINIQTPSITHVR